MTTIQEVRQKEIDGEIEHFKSSLCFGSKRDKQISHIKGNS